MNIQIYVDVSSKGYGASLLGDSNIIAMLSIGCSKHDEHSSTLEVEGLVRTLRAFKPFILGQQLTPHYTILR